MDYDTICKEAENLEVSIDQLTDENQLCFLRVLEALTFAQNIGEIPTEPEAV